MGIYNLQSNSIESLKIKLLLKHRNMTVTPDNVINVLTSDIQLSQLTDGGTYLIIYILVALLVLLLNKVIQIEFWVLFSILIWNILPFLHVFI